MHNYLLRPTIHWGKIALRVILTVGCASFDTIIGILLLMLFKIGVDLKICIVLFLVSLLAIVCSNLSSIIIQCVYIYQRYAPDHVRLACRFKPSCSEYMILSVRRYGAVKGTIKGLKRIIRCRPPNGGIDYP